MILSHDLLDLYAAVLRELPFVEDVRFDSVFPKHVEARTPDVSVALHTPRGEVQLLGEVKTSYLTHSVANGMLSRLGPETGRWIVLARHVGRPLGRLFRDAGLNYLDESPLAVAAQRISRFGTHFMKNVLRIR